MRKLLIITEQDSVLSNLLKNSFDFCDQITPNQVLDVDLDCYDVFAVLGGPTKDGITFLPRHRKKLDEQIFKGKKCFAEFVHGIGQLSFLETKSTRFARPVLINKHAVTGDLEPGVLFDEQCNERLFVYKATNRTTPILQYVDYPRGFYSVPDVSKIENKLDNYALWQEGDNLLVSSFRLCNFSEAKFSPRHVWVQVIHGIVTWLGGKLDKQAVWDAFNAAYMLENGTDIAQSAEKAMAWYEDAGMLVNIGGAPYAVKEGVASEVYADGTHKYANEIRLDCTGESAMAYLFKALWKKSDQDMAVAEGLYRMPLDMQITEDCPHKGMTRGSWTGWWHVSYSDDCCRGFILPLLFRQLLTGKKDHETEIRMALDYLLSTTGTDHLRCERFDFYNQYDDEVQARVAYSETVDLGDGKQGTKWIQGGGISGSHPIAEFTSVPANFPSLHFNGYYMAALFFAAKLFDEKRYLDAGLAGMNAIMDSYPFTARIVSETEEDCRLILPLAILYWATGEEKHRDWLYRVAKDMQAFRHPKGGYMEWDTGYTSGNHGIDDGECSLLCENGNPIMEQLYSLNWLPMGFSLAHIVTQDPWFKELWQDICLYFARVQIKSPNKLINGAWPRAFDVELNEVYGIPNDVGWAPWSIESGWTMGPVAGGMILGLIENEIKSAFYSK